MKDSYQFDSVLAERAERPEPKMCRTRAARGPAALGRVEGDQQREVYQRARVRETMTQERDRSGRGPSLPLLQSR